MLFTATKCYIITIHRGRSCLPHMYQLRDTFLSISKVEPEKYLGVLLSSDSSWGLHISKTAVTSSQKLGFMKRNLKGCPTELKRMAYISGYIGSGIRLYFWDPHLAKHKNLLHDVQEEGDPLYYIILPTYIQCDKYDQTPASRATRKCIKSFMKT